MAIELAFAFQPAGVDSSNLVHLSDYRLVAALLYLPFEKGIQTFRSLIFMIS